MGYAARDACRLSGCAYRTLDYWCKSGVLRPSVQAAAGKGSDRVFSAIDVRCLMLLTALRRQVTLPVAVQFADYLRQHPDLGSGHLLCKRWGGEVAALRRDAVTVVDIGAGPMLLVCVPELREGAA